MEFVSHEDRTGQSTNQKKGAKGFDIKWEGLLLLACPPGP